VNWHDKEWEKINPSSNKYSSKDKNKRYTITRKVYYGKAYLSDDIIEVEDYMKDYVLNPLLTIESSMYEYYLHSIYDNEKGEYINAITL